MKRVLLYGWIGLVLTGGTIGAASPRPSPVRPSPPSLVPLAEVRVAGSAPADTLRRRVSAGDDLIVTLPGTLSRRSVASYRIVQAPALSWLVDRSLLWRTRQEDVGTHALFVEAAFAQAEPDTVTVLVEVTR